VGARKLVADGITAPTLANADLLVQGSSIIPTNSTEIIATWLVKKLSTFYGTYSFITHAHNSPLLVPILSHEISIPH
jgi:hypothetical protein